MGRFFRNEAQYSTINGQEDAAARGLASRPTADAGELELTDVARSGESGGESITNEINPDENGQSLVSLLRY